MWKAYSLQPSSVVWPSGNSWMVKFSCKIVFERRVRAFYPAIACVGRLPALERLKKDLWKPHKLSVTAFASNGSFRLTQILPEIGSLIGYEVVVLSRTISMLPNEPTSRCGVKIVFDFLLPIGLPVIVCLPQFMAMPTPVLVTVDDIYCISNQLSLSMIWFKPASPAECAMAWRACYDISPSLNSSIPSEIYAAAPADLLILAIEDFIISFYNFLSN